MTNEDLTQQETHFAFGKNWASYAAHISGGEIDEAVRGLSRLLGNERLQGKRFLDIGCGSGLHSLAAIRLGAREVMALDIDPDSVATTQAVLLRHAPEGNSTVQKASVFDLDPGDLGMFDVVYSWGVLHHTGDMIRAVRTASRLVAPGGFFVFALYRRVWMDRFWKYEKRWYANASAKAQARARAIYVALFRLGLRLTGRKLASHVANYQSNRGMDFFHDVHDWMGGWPYESISSAEVESLMNSLDFGPLQVFARQGKVAGRNIGAFGSGCDEYVYRRGGGTAL